MTVNNAPKIGGILLAAGGSTRFGSPKQLYKFEGKTLIHRAAEILCTFGCSPVVAVLGSEAIKSAEELSDIDISIAMNNDWHSGMSSSITAGLESLLDIDPQLDAVLITLVDQPLVTHDDLSKLITAFEQQDAEIAASQYNDTVGVPAIFGRTLFERLSKLTGDKGAKELIRATHNVVKVELANAAYDIDTLDDLRRQPTNSSK